MFPKVLPPTWRTAQALGLTTSLFACTFGFTTTYLLIPRLLETRSAPLLSQQWRTTFYRGAYTIVPLALTSSLAYLYLSYSFYNAHSKVFGGEWKVNLFAGLAMLGVVPYTRIVMGDVNGKLMERAEELEGQGLGKEDVVGDFGEVGVSMEGETVHALVDWWGTLNMGRAAVFGMASLAGIYAALG